MTSVEMFVIDETESGWRLRYGVSEQGGRLIIRSLLIEPIGSETPPGGVTAKLLRTIQLWKAMTLLDAPAYGPPTPFKPPPKRSVGRPRLSDDLLHKVAIAYLEEQHHGPHLMARVAERFGTSETRARDWVRRARQEGFLTAAGQGRKGALPGPRFTAQMIQEGGN